MKYTRHLKLFTLVSRKVCLGRMRQAATVCLTVLDPPILPRSQRLHSGTECSLKGHYINFWKFDHKCWLKNEAYMRNLKKIPCRLFVFFWNLNTHEFLKLESFKRNELFYMYTSLIFGLKPMVKFWKID